MMKAILLLILAVSVIPVSIITMMWGWRLKAESWGWIAFGFIYAWVILPLVGTTIKAMED